MTRGRCGLLTLHRMELSSIAPRWFHRRTHRFFKEKKYVVMYTVSVLLRASIFYGDIAYICNYDSFAICINQIYLCIPSLQTRQEQGGKDAHRLRPLTLQVMFSSNGQHFQSTRENGSITIIISARYSSFVSGVPSGLRKTVMQNF